MRVRGWVVRFCGAFRPLHRRHRHQHQPRAMRQPDPEPRVLVTGRRVERRGCSARVPTGTGKINGQKEAKLDRGTMQALARHGPGFELLMSVNERTNESLRSLLEVTVTSSKFE